MQIEEELVRGHFRDALGVDDVVVEFRQERRRHFVAQVPEIRRRQQRSRGGDLVANGHEDVAHVRRLLVHDVQRAPVGGRHFLERGLQGRVDRGDDFLQGGGHDVLERFDFLLGVDLRCVGGVDLAFDDVRQLLRRFAAVFGGVQGVARHRHRVVPRQEVVLRRAVHHGFQAVRVVAKTVAEGPEELEEGLARGQSRAPSDRRLDVREHVHRRREHRQRAVPVDVFLGGDLGHHLLHVLLLQGDVRLHVRVEHRRQRPGHLTSRRGL
mmetsp:Transcript_12449/g.37566  ORF Transcript_12449/g.37566 Transcript_12449/m.37566 type:complete len:267 (-) Transcript_12449:1188-1988(-)